MANSSPLSEWIWSLNCKSSKVREREYRLSGCKYLLAHKSPLKLLLLLFGAIISSVRINLLYFTWAGHVYKIKYLHAKRAKRINLLERVNELPCLALTGNACQTSRSRSQNRNRKRNKKASLPVKWIFKWDHREKPIGSSLRRSLARELVWFLAKDQKASL